MRISTDQIFQRALNNMLTQQARTSKLQGQLSSGLRVETPSDDPVAAAQMEIMNQFINTTELLQKNRQRAENGLQMEESILSGVMVAVQRLQEIQVQAGNSSLSKEDRKALAVEAKNCLNQLQDYANTKDSNGAYMFSGGQANTPPISQNTQAQYVYNGDSTQRFQAIANSVQIAVSDTGDAVFMRIPNGNGRFTVRDPIVPNTGTASASSGAVVNAGAYVADNYTLSFATNTQGQLVVMVSGAASGNVLPSTGLPDDAPVYQTEVPITFNGIEITVSGAPQAGDSFLIAPAQNESIFSTVQRMVANLNAPFTTTYEKAATQTENNQLLAQLDSALTHILLFQADLGSRLNTLESVEKANANLIEASTETLKQLKEIDPIVVATQYNLQLVNLQAAQQSFVKIQGLSLFNYL